MKSLIFDSGPLISLTMNNLLWLVKPLRKHFRGEFLIPESVKSELVDKPLKTRKFKFEAIQVQEYISDKTLKVVPDRNHRKDATSLLALANSCFTSREKPLSIVHYAEIACLVAASKGSASALVMDERITREFVENPQRLLALMQKKLHATVRMNKPAVREFTERTADVRIIRSAELATVAFEKGLLNRYTPPAGTGAKTVLESVLWGLKLDGCAINESGIRAILAAAL